MTVPRFDFRLSVNASCFTIATCDRVGLSLTWSGGPSVSTTMLPDEARAMANALYEAADASEKVLPVAAATVTA